MDIWPEINVSGTALCTKTRIKRYMFRTHLTIWEHKDTSKQHNINLYLYPEQEMGECKAHVVSKSKHTKKLQQKHFQTLLWQPKKICLLESKLFYTWARSANGFMKGSDSFDKITTFSVFPHSSPSSVHSFTQVMSLFTSQQHISMTGLSI